MLLYKISIKIIFFIAIVVIVPTTAQGQLVTPDTAIGGLNLLSSPEDVRNWARSQGLSPTEAKKPDQEVYILKSQGKVGRGIGFIPGSKGLNQLFYNQSGIVRVNQAISAIESRYGKPDKIFTEGGFKKMFYPIVNPKNPGIMVWAVRYDWLGVEMLSDRYQVEMKMPMWQRRFVRWWKPTLLGISLVLGLFFLYKITPPPIRVKIGSALAVIFGPLLAVAGFFGSRLFTFVLGFIMLPLMIFSGCAVGAGALEQGTSWLWGILWIMGMILMFENDSTDDFRYIVLADLAFIVTAAGVIFQMAF